MSNTDVIVAWEELKAAWRRFATLALDANHFARVEAVIQHEVETVVRETADEWDDASGMRTLLTRIGLNPLLEFVRKAVSKALRKYCRQP